MAQEISQERQSEIAHANQLQVEVMKGLQCGEPVERLLLKALESMALKENDTVSYPEAKKTLKAMADLIAHRGPDGEGFYVDERAALGHRRLSIIDLEGGSQPMFNEDKTLVTVFNGEIYNFMELRGQLEAAGHVFATHSDTEVLLHGYEEWGEALPEKLRGMFAFVIWNKAEGTLFGARDIFGIKPFYYYQNGDLLLFGSEIKSFLPHPGFVKELNEERLPEYLSIEYIPNAETMFKNVYKLPGAHRFTFKDGKLTVSRYYDIAYHVDHSKTLEDWKKAIADILVRKARAGVEVRLLYDAIGSWKLSERFVRRLRGAGIEVRAYAPLRFPWFLKPRRPRYPASVYKCQ